MANLINGGFLIVKAQAKGHDMPLLPVKLRSASECICDQFPHPAVIEWAESSKDEQKDYLEKMGIPLSRAAEATKWSTDNFEKNIGWPNTFYNFETAKAAKELFFKDDEDVSIIGIGLPEEYAASYIEFATASLKRPDSDEDFGKSGTLEMIEKGEFMPESGKLLGYELLSTEDQGMILHSYMCSAWEKDFSLALGIKPNKQGFLSDLESARKCLIELEKHTDDPDVEAGLWLPWAVFEYS
ncbi:MAG: hypothetical protein DI586_08980 [Micavibrio aeruginosavorus]|uniref:Uncharacterized protein n=1 Tax=Micavibrio aeruginosavorus TaxID=349221 RepID=A0A2W5HLS5_9BACT|nr:MAG: hypothetical protein DI586_08980 [Micavibrio aeruginosavorus]